MRISYQINCLILANIKVALRQYWPINGMSARNHGNNSEETRVTYTATEASAQTCSEENRVSRRWQELERGYYYIISCLDSLNDPLSRLLFGRHGCMGLLLFLSAVAHSDFLNRDIFVSILPRDAATLARYWGIVILSVCPPVTCVLCDETKKNILPIFWYRMKG